MTSTDLRPLAADPDRLWSYADGADWAGVPERTFRYWCNTPGGPPTVKLGKHVRMRVGDVLAWWAAQPVRTAA